MGVKRPTQKLTEEQRTQIFALADAGVAGREIARRMSISSSTANGTLRERRAAANRAAAEAGSGSDADANANAGATSAPSVPLAAVSAIADRAEKVTRKILAALSAAASGRPSKSGLGSMDLARVARVALDARKLEQLLAGAPTSRSASMVEAPPAALTPAEQHAQDALQALRDTGRFAPRIASSDAAQPAVRLA